MQQKKTKQNIGKGKKQNNDSGSDEDNSSDDQRDSDIEDDEEYGPTSSQPQKSQQQSNQNEQSIKTNVKKNASKQTNTINGNYSHDIEEDDTIQKNNKAKSKKRNNKVIDDSEEEKVKGIYFNTPNTFSEINQQTLFSSTSNKTQIFNQSKSSASTTSSSSSYSNQQGNIQNDHSLQMTSSLNNGSKNSNINITLQGQNSIINNYNSMSNSKVTKTEVNMVIETEDDEEEVGGDIPINSQLIGNSFGNLLESQNKTNILPTSRLDETLAKYQPLVQQNLSEEKTKQPLIKEDSLTQRVLEFSQKEQIDSSAKQQGKIQNMNLKKSQNQDTKQNSSNNNNLTLKKQQSQDIRYNNSNGTILSLKKQISLDTKQNNSNNNNEQLRMIRSKQSSLISNQQQIIEENDDNSDLCRNNSSMIDSSALKNEIEENSKIAQNRNRLNNESSQARDSNSDENDDDSDSDSENLNQRLTRSSKRKQIKKPLKKKEKDDKVNKDIKPQDANATVTKKKCRVTRSKTQLLKIKKQKGKLSDSTQQSNKQHILRTRSTIKNSKGSINKLKKNLNKKDNSKTNSENNASHSSPQLSNINFQYNDKILNLEDEFNQLFSHLQSMDSLDYFDTFKILEDIIQKIKIQEPKVDNIVGILGSDNGKLLVCAKNLLFTESFLINSHSSFSIEKINQLKSELDSLIDTLQSQLFKRFFDHEEKLRVLKTINVISNKNKEIEELEKITQKSSPQDKKNDIDNFTNQVSSTSSISSLRPRKESSSQQLKDMQGNQSQQCSNQSKDSNDPVVSSIVKELASEQSLVGLIQMQNETSIKILENNTINMSDSVNSFTRKISNCGEQSVNSQFNLITTQNYSLGTSDSSENKASSKQIYSDKMIDEQAEGKRDKENNTNNLTEDQKLMRRKICLKIIKPLNRILKDQALVQNYAKNIETMIRQKYPSMCTEYKNICKNLITLITSNVIINFVYFFKKRFFRDIQLQQTKHYLIKQDFDTTSAKIDEYLNSNTPENIKIIYNSYSIQQCNTPNCRDIVLNFNGDRDCQFSSERLKHNSSLNDESNNSLPNRTPVSRKFSTLSNKMEEEDNNFGRFDNSSESGVNHDPNNQSLSGEEKPSVFENFMLHSNTNKPQQNTQNNNNIIIDEEESEEEVQVQIPKNTNFSSLSQSISKQQEECKVNNKLLSSAKKENIEKQEIDQDSEKMEVEEKEEATTSVQNCSNLESVKSEEINQQQEKISSPQKNDEKIEDESQIKIQEEDDDDEDEVDQQQPESKHHDSKNSIHPQQKEENNNQTSQTTSIVDENQNEQNEQNQLKIGIEQYLESQKNKLLSATKVNELETENENLNTDSINISDSTNKEQKQTNKENEFRQKNQFASEIEKINKDKNHEPSSIPRLCGNIINVNATTSIMTEQ